jgi:hypothetical protein
VQVSRSGDRAHHHWRKRMLTHRWYGAGVFAGDIKMNTASTMNAVLRLRCVEHVRANPTGMSTYSGMPISSDLPPHAPRPRTRPP